eukprot:1139885-Pelagomonas_calceolata.AAC.3
MDRAVCLSMHSVMGMPVCKGQKGKEDVHMPDKFSATPLNARAAKLQDLVPFDAFPSYDAALIRVQLLRAIGVFLHASAWHLLVLTGRLGDDHRHITIVVIQVPLLHQRDTLQALMHAQTSEHQDAIAKLAELRKQKDELQIKVERTKAQKRIQELQHLPGAVQTSFLQASASSVESPDAQVLQACQVSVLTSSQWGLGMQGHSTYLLSKKHVWIPNYRHNWRLPEGSGMI